jgi:WD40-like Beta Propeller Repeat
MDWQEFDKNRAAFPPEELLRYRGQYIAWSPDGTRIIASDTDGLKLDDILRALGYNPAEVIFSSVPDAETLFIERPTYQRGKARAILDLCQRTKNRLAFPPQEVFRHRGKYIAWSPDGSRVIASDEDFLTLDETVKALRYNPSDVVYEPGPEGDSFIA